MENISDIDPSLFYQAIGLLVGDLLLSSFEEAHKPMFYLKPADGAMGSHMQAVQSAYADFNLLAQRIAEKITVPIKQSRF